MITKKQKIDNFKRECKIAEYYKKCLEEMELEFYEISIRMQNIHSINLEKQKIVNNCRENNILYWMDKEDKLVQRKEDYIKFIKRVDKQLDKIKNIEDREMLNDFLYSSKNQEAIAQKYHYSRQNLYKRIDKIISEIV